MPMTATAIASGTAGAGSYLKKWSIEFNNAAETIDVSHGLSGIPIVWMSRASANVAVTLPQEPYIGAQPDANQFSITKGVATPSDGTVDVFALYHSIIQ